MAERKPRTAAEAGGLADDYIQARKQTKEEKKAAEASDRKPTSSNGFRRYESGGQFGQSTRDFRKTSLPKEGQSSTRPANYGGPNTGAGGQAGPNTGAGGQGPRRDYRQVRCYNCSQWGHTANRCPNRALYCGTGRLKRSRPQEPDAMEPGITRGGVVEGRFVTDILLDTECSRTLVKKHLVPPEKILEGEAVMIRCAHGDTVLYPLAEVDMELQGMKIQVEAAVSPNLPASVLLGTDVPALKELLGDSIKLEDRREEVALVTVTRAQKKKQLIEEVAERQREQESGA